MTALVLDTGALIALEHNDRATWALLGASDRAGGQVYVPAGVVAQAWRDGGRRAQMARALRHCHEVPLDGPSARAVGVLCGATDTSDIVDASVAIVATTLARHQPTTVLTSDTNDLRTLLTELGCTARIESV